MTDFLNTEIFDRLKFGVVDTTNNCFKLFSNLSPAIFWLSAALVIATSYIGDPIRCKGNGDDNFINTVCWIHGTYHLKDKLGNAINKGTCLRSYDGDEYADWTEADKDADTAYYQWVPFMLTIHGLIFFIPATLWNYLENDLLEQFGTKKDISVLIKKEEMLEVAKENAKRFKALSRGRNNRYFFKYILCEIGNIIALWLNFHLMDIFLSGRFKTYGAEVLAYSMGNRGSGKPLQTALGAANPMCSVFPTLTSCSVKFGGVAKDTADVSNVICILSQNIINQKLYLAIWFWMAILFVACAMNTIYRLAIILVPALRKQELVWLIKSRRRRNEFLTKDHVVKEQWEEFGKLGNWFVLCQIGRNSNSYYFREFLHALIKNDESRETSAVNTETNAVNTKVWVANDTKGLAGATKEPFLGAN